MVQDGLLRALCPTVGTSLPGPNRNQLAPLLGTVDPPTSGPCQASGGTRAAQTPIQSLAGKYRESLTH